MALSYAPSAPRAVALDLFELDRRLANAVRQASEPMTGQLRLAWWRDRFAEEPGAWPEGEPLLARLALWNGGTSQLGAMVDGWEALLVADTLTPDIARSFAEGRGQGWAAVALALGEKAAAPAAASAGTWWALADLAQHCGSDEDRKVAFALAHELPEARPLPRSLRMFAVLATIARRAIRLQRLMLARPGDMAAAMRVGIFGR
ncbi:hypothetical protein F7D01_14525 [Erythrobacter sp. 3-20A1M]|nr:hypothetical protein F7D01_14525 [Erythrobacter sp. 3-20A1M]